MNEFYTDYSEYLNRFFNDRKVQKISVNVGFSCPNRDGTLGTGGCIYCNNSSFTPSYCFNDISISEQIEKGKKFFSKKYKNMQYLAYFQSYTNTYGHSNDELEGIYREALSIDDIVGLIIGTRPDCIDDDTIGLLSRINDEYPVFVEIGVETMHDSTLKKINRRHDSSQSLECLRRLIDAGIHTGVHIIMGLPCETEEMMFDTIKRICELGVESIKLHHLQVLRGTRLHEMYEKGEVKLSISDPEHYLDLCDKVVRIVPKGITIERFLASSPPEMVIAPKWGIKNYEFTNLLLKRLKNNVSK